MKTFRFQLPLYYNGGEKIKSIDIKFIENRAIEICGGISFDGTTEGFWTNEDGHEFEETQNVYLVSVPSEKESEFINLMKVARDLLKQEAIYVVELGNALFI